jgi:5-methylcytosine-specific restriction enzyme A
LQNLKFETFIESSLAEQFEEGDRIRREVTTLARNPTLVAQAKKRYGLVCRACHFNFEAYYGKLGSGYIECHHIDPLSGRDGRSKPTTIADVTVLCANCHRMVHSRTPCLTLEELKRALDEAASSGIIACGLSGSAGRS